ncbi:MAG: YciI family protein [Cyclobacteriaceae bacterium]
MKQFLYLIRGGDEKFNKLSPEEFEAHMAKWGKWMSEIKAEGFPLDAAGQVVSGGGSIVSNGPFAEGVEVVGGYLLLPANDMAHATDLAKGCPVHEMDGTVEVRPINPMHD